MNNLYEHFDNDDLTNINNICILCEKQCHSNYYLILPKCQHGFHFSCFLINTLTNTSFCPKCLTFYNKSILYSHNNIQSRVMVKNYQREYRIGLSHYVNYERKGYSYVIGINEPLYPIIIHISIKDTKHDFYIFGKSSQTFYSSPDKQYLLKINDLHDVNNFYSYSLKPNITEDNIKQLDVKVVNSNVLVIVANILLNDGLNQSEFPETFEIESFLKDSSMINTCSIERRIISNNKLLN